MRRDPAKSLYPLLGLLLLGLGLVLRLQAARNSGAFVDPPELFQAPLRSLPLLDCLFWVGQEARLPIVVLLSMACAVAVGSLVSRVLPLGAALLGLAAATLCPALIFVGAHPVPHNLVLLTAPLAAWALLAELQGQARHPAVLPIASTLLLCSDWPTASPVLAWLGWLLFLRPTWLRPEHARRAVRALLVSLALAALPYGVLIRSGANPWKILGAETFPTGAAAAEQLLNSAASLWLGDPRGSSLLMQGCVALTFGFAGYVGYRRALRAGAPAWASVLWVGSIGALVPALAIQQALPFAAYKNLWFMTPLLLALSVAALWPTVDLKPEAASPRSEAPRFELSGAALPLGLLLSMLLINSTSCTPVDDPAVPRGQDEFHVETEPNDASLGSCFAPEGDDLGHLALEGFTTHIDGRIDHVVDGSYLDGDLDCFAFRIPEVETHPRLRIELSWDDEDTDLDLALQGLWEGTQAGFAQSQAPGPGPEVVLSSSGFDTGAPLWLWIAAYEGPPSNYRLKLLLD